MLVLPTELTQNGARASLQTLQQALRSHSGQQVVADAGALARFDSSALAVLLACRRDCLADGKTFVVKDAPPKLRSLAGLYGVSELLPPAS